MTATRSAATAVLSQCDHVTLPLLSDEYLYRYSHLSTSPNYECRQSALYPVCLFAYMAQIVYLTGPSESQAGFPPNFSHLKTLEPKSEFSIHCIPSHFPQICDE